MSIGHIKGRIHSTYRNIYCASGVIHLIDTVLAIPYRNAYQEIASRSDLTILKSLIDQSSYASLLNQAVGVYNYALITNPYNNQQSYYPTGSGYTSGTNGIQRMAQSKKDKKSAVRPAETDEDASLGSASVEQPLVSQLLLYLSKTIFIIYNWKHDRMSRSKTRRQLQPSKRQLKQAD